MRGKSTSGKPRPESSWRDSTPTATSVRMTKMIGLPCRAVQCSSLASLLVLVLVGFLAGPLLARLQHAHLRLVLEAEPADGDDALARPRAPAAICTISASRTPICRLSSDARRSCRRRSRRSCRPSSLGRSAVAGTSIAPSIVAATIATCTDVPGAQSSRRDCRPAPTPAPSCCSDRPRG